MVSERSLKRVTEALDRQKATWALESPETKAQTRFEVASAY